MKMQKNKRAMEMGLTALISLAITFVVAVVVLSMGGNLLTSVLGTQTIGTAAANVTQFGAAGLMNIGNNLPTIATIIVLVVIISLIVGVLYFVKGTNGP